MNYNTSKKKVYPIRVQLLQTFLDPFEQENVMSQQTFSNFSQNAHCKKIQFFDSPISIDKPNLSSTQGASEISVEIEVISDSRSSLHSQSSRKIDFDDTDDKDLITLCAIKKYSSENEVDKIQSFKQNKGIVDRFHDEKLFNQSENSNRTDKTSPQPNILQNVKRFSGFGQSRTPNNNNSLFKPIFKSPIQQNNEQEVNQFHNLDISSKFQKKLDFSGINSNEKRNSDLDIFTNEQQSPPISFSQPTFNNNQGLQNDSTHFFSQQGSSSANSFDQLRKVQLKTVKNTKNPDLDTISSQTLVELINDNTKPYLIIDCRYSYEYQGGHIKGAINIKSRETLRQLLFEKPNLLKNSEYLKDLKEDPESIVNLTDFSKYEDSMQNSDQSPILIFHCEFSHKRGPRAMKELREIDTNLNQERWPQLYYEQRCLLDGGYNSFHQDYPELCTPQGGYIGMFNEAYSIEMAKEQAFEKEAWQKKQVQSFKNPLQMFRRKQFSFQ